MILRFLKTDEAIQDGVVLPSAEWQEAVNRFNLNLILVLAGIHEEMGTLQLLEIRMRQRVQDPFGFEDADAVVVIRGQDETQPYIAPETLFGRLLSSFKLAIEKVEFQREKALNFRGALGSSQNQRRFLTLWLMGEQPPEPSDAEFTGRKPRNPSDFPVWHYESDFPGKSRERHLAFSRSKPI